MEPFFKGLGAFFVFAFTYLSMASVSQGQGWDSNQPQSTSERMRKYHLVVVEENNDVISNPEIVRPFAEYEKVKYLFLQGGTVKKWDSELLDPIRQAILQNLPEEVTVVLYTSNVDDYPAMKEKWSKILPPDRIKFFHLAPSGSDFWARDSLPVPVFSMDRDREEQALVNARYFKNWEPDWTIGQILESPVLSHRREFEGGNFQADTKGNCFAMDSQYLQILSDAFFKSFYGCQTMTRLPYINTGVGHVDEVVRLVNDQLVLTHLEEYRKIFESKGYQVLMLPSPPDYFQSYANSLIVNGTVFVPIYGVPQDSEALAVYQTLGLKVVPINSSAIARHEGSLHCITMAYPQGKIED